MDHHHIGRCSLAVYVLLFLVCLLNLSMASSGVANVTLTWEGGGPLCPSCEGGDFVHSFACSFGDRGNWSNGEKYFTDPTPADSILTNITAVLYGTIGCNAFHGLNTVFLLGSTVFASTFLTPNLPCYCANCVGGVYVYSDIDSTCPFPDYQHGTNSFQIIIDGENYLCLNRVELYLSYVEAAPFNGTISPTLGPTSGQTQIVVQGYTPPAGGIVCVFNSTTVPATLTGPSTVQCTSPPNLSGTVPFYVTTSSSCANTPPPSSNPTVFHYYSPPNITGVLPGKGSTRGGTAITISGSSFLNTSALSCKIGTFTAHSVYINDSNIICTAPQGSGQGLHVFLSFNGQQFEDTNFVFDYEAPNGFWTATTTSWIILSISGVAALGLILLFIGLIKSKFKKDGYHQIVEGKQITIDEVRLGPRIGKGNFGEVYKAYWRGAEIAVKKLPAHNMTEQFLKDFHKEVSLMRALRHPNVIQFLGSCTVLPDICICTEFMPRGSLYKILHDPSQTLTWALIKKMCVDAAKGCVYLHDCTPIIVHRDLKSHNLLVDENWKVKVCDFGLSTIVEQASRTMTACGTPCWTAPEVLRNQRYTEKADVYSFGVVLWECATREDPFVGMPPFQVIFAVGREGLRPPLPRVCPTEFAKLITECWDEKPNARPSMKDVLARLEDIDTTGWPDISIHNPSPIMN